MRQTFIKTNSQFQEYHLNKLFLIQKESQEINAREHSLINLQSKEDLIQMAQIYLLIMDLLSKNRLMGQAKYFQLLLVLRVTLLIL